MKPTYSVTLQQRDANFLPADSFFGHNNAIAGTMFFAYEEKIFNHSNEKA